MPEPEPEPEPDPGSADWHGRTRRPPLRQRPSPARPGAIGAGESPRPDEEFGASESMAAAFCALFAPGDGGVVMQPCAGSVLAAELSLG